MKICIVRTDKMGDMILTLPIIQGLKEINKDLCSSTKMSSTLTLHVAILLRLVSFTTPVLYGSLATS